METQEAGFTLIELMIVTMIIAIIAAIAVPNSNSARIIANEVAAISNLNRISASQAHVRAATEIDSDRNGTGEYGFFQELSGLRNHRIDSDGDGLSDSEGTDRVSPRVLSATFGDVDDDGVIQRSGYLFRLYLPGENLEWTREPGATGNFQGVSASHAQRFWACYAWPLSYGNSGERVFFINQFGQILACSNKKTQYSGLGNPPVEEGVLMPGSDNKMNQPPAINSIGKDENFWRVLR